MWNGRRQTENNVLKPCPMFMKAVLLLFCLVSPVQALARNIEEDCTYDGIRLFGRVQVVTDFADIKVQKKGSVADLAVQFVSAFPDACGEWQLVDSFPDFTVQFVESFPDITIKEVRAFAGAR